MRSILPASLLLLAGFLPAQNCGTLSTTGTGAAGTTLSIDLAGAPAGGLAVLVVGENAGSTSLPLPMGGNLVLGVATPFIPVPMGRTDLAGAVSLSFDVPQWVSQQYTVQAQAAVLSVSMMPLQLSVCASNVVAVTIG